MNLITKIMLDGKCIGEVIDNDAPYLRAAATLEICQKVVDEHGGTVEFWQAPTRTKCYRVYEYTAGDDKCKFKRMQLK